MLIPSLSLPRSQSSLQRCGVRFDLNVGMVTVRPSFDLDKSDILQVEFPRRMRFPPETIDSIGLVVFPGGAVQNSDFGLIARQLKWHPVEHVTEHNCDRRTL
jgi:hypothetical protein